MRSGEHLHRADTRRLLFAASGIVFGAALWRRFHSREQPVSSPLAPDRAGMSLREAFETFPRCGCEPASLLLFSDNTESWVERWRLIASAERSLDVSYFILNEDVFGLSFLGHLLERAQAGVKVRILLDSIGTRMSREIAGNFLNVIASHPNVTVRTYRPLWRRWAEAVLTLRPSALIASEHDKIVIADGERCLIGGRNIASEYFSDPAAKPDAFRDMDLRLDSQAVAEALKRAFECQLETEDTLVSAGDETRQPELLEIHRAMDDWLHGREPVEPAGEQAWLEELKKNPRLRGALDTPRSAPVRAETRVVDSPGRFNSPDDPITEALRRLVQAARREIFVQTPYVVLSEPGVRLMEEASRRGVAITILTNSPVSSDNALSQAFFLEQWPEILARVPTLRLFVAGDGHTLHAKAVTFDGELAMVGTYNLDPVSMACNSEVMAASWSRELVRLTELPARRAIESGAPRVFEYRIQRTDDHSPVIGEDGKVAIAFGACDHCSPEEWTALTAGWGVLRAAKDFVGFSPFL